MRVLVTRPRPDADRTAAELSARGHAHLVAPLFTVVIDADARIDLAGVQAVLVTSANGARALAAVTDRRDIHVLAGGDASAEAACDGGFGLVTSAAGDVDTLAALVYARLSPADGRLLHVTGSVIAGDLAGRLGAAGFTIERAVLYRASPVDSIPEAMEEVLRAGTLDAALFYSPRTAARFVELLIQAKLADACGEMLAVALSPAVAAKLGPVPFAAIRVAEEPHQESLLQALDSAAPIRTGL